MKGVTAADIGTDHALLPIRLVEKKTCTKVYACDIAKGPLQAAQANIAKAGMEGSISVILSDGLQNVPKDTNAIVIAGMGCLTAIGILEQDLDRVRKMKQVLVEVNRDTLGMRRWINDHSFEILDEVFIEDRGHDYVAISFAGHYTGTYTEQQLLLGPVLMQKKDPAYLCYCQRQKKKREEILAKSQGKSQANDLLMEQLKMYEDFLNH